MGVVVEEQKALLTTLLIQKSVECSCICYLLLLVHVSKVNDFVNAVYVCAYAFYLKKNKNFKTHVTEI